MTKRKKGTSKTIFKSCTFYLGEGHIFADDIKREKSRKREKKIEKVKKCHEGHKTQNGPPSATKQMVSRKYETGLYEVMLIFGQNFIKNDAFDLQKIMRQLV